MKHIPLIAALLVATPVIAAEDTQATGTPPSAIEMSIGDKAEPGGNLAATPEEADDPAVVRKLQQMLGDLGYYGGEVTGEYDLRTQEAWDRYRDTTQEARTPTDKPTAKVPEPKPTESER